MDNLREKLTELLDDIQQNGNDFEEIERHGMRYPDTVSNEVVADHLIANGVTVQRWIPISERLPGEDDINEFGEVLVVNRSGEVRSAIYTPSYGRFFRKAFPCADVTHWMPMPEAPKEVE